MTQAQSVRYLPSGVVELIDLKVNDPAPGEVQIEGKACGICSWDIATCGQGDKMKFPAPPGHEGVGVVRKLGPGVTGLNIGDRVAGGGFQSVRNMAAASVYVIPPSTLPDKQWIVEPVSCAVTGLDHCRLQAGDRVVLIGAGFMGLLLLQGLAHSFAGEVIVLDVVEERLEKARELGAGSTINLATADVDAVAKELKARAIDTVIDATGNQRGLDLATRIVKRGGLINLFGWIKDEIATFEPSLWHLGGFTIVNSAPASKLRDTFPPAIRLLETGLFDLGPLITHVARLDEYPALMAQILTGDSTYIKGVIEL